MRRALPTTAFVSTLIAAAFSALPGPASANYAAGSLVVVRVGDGTTTPSSASFAVFLDNFSTGGTHLGSLALPTSPDGTEHAFTLSGTASSEGALSRSADGRYVVLAGYAAAPGVSSVASTTSAAVNRTVARIDVTGDVNTTTALSTAFSGNNIRGAATADGSAFWVSGAASGSGVAGIEYTSLGATSGEVQVLANPNNTRAVEVQNGQLYATSNRTSYSNVFTVGSGLPITSGQTATPLPGFTATGPSPFAFAIDATGTVCYVADDDDLTSGGGVQKWTKSAGTWTLAATFTNGLPAGVRGLAVDWSGATPHIYVTTADSPGNQLMKFDDNGGSPTAVSLATAAANTSFRGVNFAPQIPAATVEPGVGGGTLGLRFAPPEPNPARDSATLRFALPRAGMVRLAIYDVNGREVRLLAGGVRAAGDHAVQWDLRDADGHPVGTGLYFARLEFAGHSGTMRLVVNR